MNGSRSRQMRGSLGDSWGEADYSSNDDASIHSASSLSDAESDFIVPYEDEEEDMATPLPPRRTAPSQTRQDTPTRVSANRSASHSTSQSITKRVSNSSHRSVSRSSTSQPRISQSTPEALEPSFIMPSMQGSVQDSPLRDSQLRTRRVRQTVHQRRRGSMNTASPPVRHRKSSTRGNYQARDYAADDELVGPGHYISLLWNNFMKPLSQYALSVIWYAMNAHLKPLLGLALTVFLLISTVQYSSGIMQNYIQTALTPICIVPGSSYILPFCSSSTASNLPSYNGQYPDFEELTKVQSTFEDVLEANKDSYALPATLKKGEMALRDLRSTVKYSRLPSRSELEVELSAFIETAGEASDHLAKYNAKIGYTMDQVISTNRWTLNTLEGIAEREVGARSISRALAYLNPFALQTIQGSLDELIFEQYVLHVSKMKDDIEALIQKSISLLGLLTNLENKLDVIAEIAVRDDLLVSRDRDELLSLLWTKLGGNRSSKKAYAESLGLLRHVQDYRKSAMQHVSATLLKLREISAELENLREGVAAPEVVGYGKVPLRYHIEVVGKSIERLRDSRGEAMAIERDTMMRGLSEDSKGGTGRLELPARKGEGATVYAT